MRRSWLVLTALALLCAVVAGRSGTPRVLPAGTARPVAAHPAPKLTVTAATRPMRQFMTSAMQVTGLAQDFRIGACTRRSARTIDCAVTIPGRTTTSLRATLTKGPQPRVQLYVLRTAAAA